MPFIINTTSETGYGLVVQYKLEIEFGFHSYVMMNIPITFSSLTCLVKLPNRLEQFYMEKYGKQESWKLMTLQIICRELKALK